MLFAINRPSFIVINEHAFARCGFALWNIWPHINRDTMIHGMINTLKTPSLA